MHYKVMSNKENSIYYTEQLSKIGQCNYLLPNRFTVNLHSKKFSFEPYEFLSYFDDGKELTFHIRVSSENIKILYSLEKYKTHWYNIFKKKFAVNVNLLDASLVPMQTITYDKCYITRIDYPYFEYNDFGDHIATVKVFMKYKKKEIL